MTAVYRDGSFSKNLRYCPGDEVDTSQKTNALKNAAAEASCSAAPRAQVASTANFTLLVSVLMGLLFFARRYRRF